MNKTMDEILQQLQYGTTMSDNTEPMLTNNRDIATKAITQAMLDVLPEKVEWDMSLDLTGGEVDQYNKAIDQMETAIKLRGSYEQSKTIS